MIIRAVHNKQNPYCMLLRNTLQDSRLPARALGILVYLMSKPDDWEPSIEDICKRFPDVGRQQAYRIINETLIPLGYARRVCERENGRVVRWVTEIYETPHDENGHLGEPDDDLQHVAPPDDDFQHVDYQMSKIITIHNKRVQNTERQNTEKKLGADAPPAPSVKRKQAKPPSDPRSNHIAIQTCRQITERYPPKELWDGLIGTLGDAPNTALLVECRTEWVKRGYNRNSWVWAIDWYLKGVPACGPLRRTASTLKERNLAAGEEAARMLGIYDNVIEAEVL